MMICHCNSIRDRDIHAAISWMRAADPATIITPGNVYRALGKKADCGGCLPLFMQAMLEAPGMEVPANLRGLRRVDMERNQA